jgi:SAM-dependent methyltransferase
MSAVPQIFDDAILATRARRAEVPLFLNAEFEARLLDRLNDVTREFESALLLTEGRGERGEDRYKKFHHPKIKTLHSQSHTSYLTPHTYDLVISAWELGSINDVPGYLAQIKQSLKPDGWFLAVFYGGESLIELRQVFWQADEEVLRGVSPRVAPMIDLRDAAGLLQRAQFALPVADSETVTIHYDNLFALMAELRGAGLANALTERRKTLTSKKYFLRAAEIYAEKYGLPDGKISVSAEVIFLSAWAPDASQQKAMIPGTATQRLADALNATEHRLSH